MKGPVAIRTSQARTERSDAAGEGELSQARLFEAVFAPSHATLLNVISDEVAKRQRRINTAEFVRLA